MNKLGFGDIVLLRFPYTDGKNYKRRPALIVNDFNDGDIVVCRITSQIYNTQYDVYIDNWEKSGLKLSSVIRVHKLATLEKSMIDTLMGQVDNSIKEKVRKIIQRITD